MVSDNQPLPLNQRHDQKALRITEGQNDDACYCLASYNKAARILMV